MSTQRFDVAVIGAGPAGAMTAYFLAKRGAKVALVDRARFPREKPCGGGVQAKTARLIPFDLSPVLETTLRGMSLSWQYGDRFTRRWPETLVFGVRRKRFDLFLVEKAVEAGAVLFDGARVKALDRDPRGVTVRAERLELAAMVAVGADGANTVIGRAINPSSAFHYTLALYAEVPREWLHPGRVDGELMRLNTGNYAAGYAWIFPKEETINIGVGGPELFGRRYRRYFADFLDAEGILNRHRAADVACPGHKIPHPTAATRFRSDRTLLVGDAAGLADPSTGDGMYTGISSARIAAQVIGDALDGDLGKLASYEARIKAEVLPDLAEARAIVALLNLNPAAFHKYLRHSDSKWAQICRSITGEESYYQLRDPYRPLWKVLDPVLNRLDDWRMERAGRRLNPS